MTRTEIYLLIFLLALAIRLFYLQQIIESPFFNYPIVDEAEYDIWAREILSSKLLWNEVPYHGPVYPYFLALIYKFFGHNYYIGRLFGVLISSLTCILIAHISMRPLGKGLGVIAGLLSAVYWPFIYWSGELVPETLTLFLNLSIFYVLWKAAKNLGPLYFFSGGLIIGLSTATRPNMLLLLPVLLIWLFRRIPRSYFMKSALTLVLGIFVVMAPITLRHYCVSGEFVLIQRQAELNLYLGLNPYLDSLHSLRPGIAWEKLMLEPIRLNLISAGEQGKYWISKAILIIFDNPGLFLKHIFRKIFFILSPYEISSGTYIPYNRNFAPLIFKLPGFWLIGPLGICGAILGIKRRRELDLYYVFLVGIFLFSLPFQTCSRYRLTLVAFLLIFALYAIRELKERITLKTKAPLTSFAVMLLLGITIVNLDIMGTRERDHARLDLTLAQVYLRMSDHANALLEIKQSLLLRPKDADVYKTLGDIYLDMKDLSKAKKAYRKALELEPEYFRVANSLGGIEGMEGNLAAAEYYFRRTLAIFPFYDKARHNLEYCAKLKGG